MRSPAVTPVTVAPERTRRATLALAWVGTLALSELLQVVLVEAVGIEAPPMLWIWLALAAVLLVVAGTWEAARPLRGYFTVMAAVIAALYLVLPLVRAWAGVEASSGMVRELKVRGSLFAVALGLAGFLLVVLRQRPRDVFLIPGNLQAPTSLRLPGMPQPPSWAVVGTITTTTLLAGGFAAQMWLEGAFPGQGLQRLLPLAPLVVAVAALNAFGEEVIYRAGPLAFLVRVVGPKPGGPDDRGVVRAGALLRCDPLGSHRGDPGRCAGPAAGQGDGGHQGARLAMDHPHRHRPGDLRLHRRGCHLTSAASCTWCG